MLPLVRIVGAALHIAAEEISPFKVGIYIAAFALESAGVGPLLLCTTSFLGVVFVIHTLTQIFIIDAC